MKKYWFFITGLLFLNLFMPQTLKARNQVKTLANTYYVDPNGNDANTGTISSPFLTIVRAQTAAVAGDLVYIRGGNYVIPANQAANFDDGTYACVTRLNKSGTASARITYAAYPNETPVFDFSLYKPTNRRVTAFLVTGNYISIVGIEVIGVQVTIVLHTQSECFRNEGSFNIYENLKMHDGKAIGFYLTKGGNNLVLNCDAYNNWDNVSETGVGGNTDGFGIHPSKQGSGYTNNVVRGCRAWFNSDDGYDCINAFESTTFENCWAFYNGYSTTFQSLGDGNGFKAGGYGVTTAPTGLATVPRNTIRFCMSVYNKTAGFYANHHMGGNDWYNNTAYKNSTNYNMLNRSADFTADVAGYGHNIKNNLNFSPRSISVSNVDAALSTLTNNSWQLPVTVTSADFLSVTESLMMQARNADGSLPTTDFLRLVPLSDLIDQGVNLGFPFNGTNPDLGCFETNAAMPIELQSITAKSNGANNVINWTTASERDNAAFQIERSNNGTDFTSIGTVKGSGTTNSTRNYNFNDEGPLLSTNYYRLRQIDVNGTSTVSKVVSVVREKSSSARFYPSVTGSELTIEVQNNDPISVNISNITGRTVLTKTVTGTEKIDVSNLSNGTYFLTLTNAGIRTTDKFVKQ